MDAGTTFRNELMTLSYRYHVHHPFDKILQSGRATPAMLRLWAANRYYYQDTIPRKDAAVISNCERSDVRAVWCKHVITHDVDNALSEWLLLTSALGLDDDEVVRGVHVLPATRFACDAYLHFCRDAPWQEGVCASMTHLFAADIHEKRITHWPHRYPWLPESAFTYFRSRKTTLPSEIDDTLELVASHFLPQMERAKQIVRFKQDILWCMLDALWHHCFSEECRVPASPPTNDEGSVLRILGSAAGGGVPQWNRDDEWNASARFGPMKTQCSVALSDRTREKWVLVNCSPDFGTQWNRLKRDHPGAALCGVVLTDAQLDHVGGLLSLRESIQPVHVYSSRRILDAVRRSGLFALLEAYVPVCEHAVGDGEAFEINGIGVTLHRVGGRVPKYDTASEGDVFAMSAGSVLYAPCVDDPARVEALVDRHEIALVDGTFETAEEMPRVGGHAPMRDTLRALSDTRTRILFLHVNNTNRATDLDMAADGMEVVLRAPSTASGA